MSAAKGVWPIDWRAQFLRDGRVVFIEHFDDGTRRVIFGAASTICSTTRAVDAAIAKLDRRGVDGRSE
jgi:hypothetical protein